MSRQRDEMLDHDADGIREFDNDLPRWWLYGFYVTVVIGVLYMVNYHVLPEPIVGHATIEAEYEADMSSAAAARSAPSVAAAGSAGGDTGAAIALLTAPEDLGKGRAIFESQTHPCAACHRQDLGGLIGPDLTDDAWLHGCSIDEVVEAVRVGFPMQGMLPYGGGPALSGEQLAQLASYVLSKRGSAPPNPKAPDPARDKACP